MAGLPPERKHAEPIRWTSADEAAAPKVNMPGRREFLARCESIRFRLDTPTSMSDADRMHARESLREDRAELLGTALRIDEVNTPEIATMVRRCAERLARAELPETFVDNSLGATNAFSMSVAPDDLQLLGFGGRLFEFMTEGEMESVIGHEMGHQALHPFCARRRASGLGRLESLVASQAREISADRVGLLACRDVRSAVSGLVKVHTELPTRFFRIDFDNLARQLEEIPATPEGLAWQLRDDQSHPFMHFRLWALWRFSDSDAYRRIVGLEGGTPLARIEDEICARFEMLGGGALLTIRGRMLVDALAWLATLLIAEQSKQDEVALRAFRQIVGVAQADQSLIILRQGGKPMVRARAEVFTEQALGADPGHFDALVRLLDGMCVMLGSNFKATETWVLLAETQRKIKASEGD